jgi:hypothetical protein
MKLTILAMLMMTLFVLVSASDRLYHNHQLQHQSAREHIHNGFLDIILPRQKPAFYSHKAQD